MKKILVVDNHPVILKFMSNLLEKEGHQVLTAEDGISALEILGTYAPDIIFIDLVMPNINGEKLCRIIRNTLKLKDAYIIILSGIAAEEAGNFIQFGANACIAKGPFNNMSKHVFDALNQSTSNGFRKKIIGLEDIYPRAVTKELLSNKRHLETILSNMSEGILELTLEGKIVYANPLAILLIGILEEELLGSNFLELFNEAQREMIKPLLETIGNIPQKITGDSPLTLNSNQISLTILSVKDEEHNSIVVILDDVTERKRMEAQLQYAQRMESIGTLAGGIAHNFNNLLMGIQGNTSLLLFEKEQGDSDCTRLNNIQKLVKNGSKLTHQLLGYARGGSYEIKPISLNQLVRETSEIFGSTRKDIKIHQEFAEDLRGIKVDQGQIEQTLLNMYVNAADAMPNGGELFLKTMNVTSEDMKDKPYEPKPGNFVLLTVRDTGIGMDQGTMERIFEPFFTTKGLAGKGIGTGLGMASAYGVVKGHGGYIDVYSEEGKGTTFEMYLLASEKVVKEQKKESPVEVVKGSGTILLVDDEETVIDVGDKMLKLLGYEVLLSMSGLEALELYEKNKDRICMVLLDIVMPGMGGGKAYDRMKEINPKIKVLLSSGYSIDGEAKEILKRGSDGFLQKPFSIEKLSESIRKILDKE